MSDPREPGPEEPSPGTAPPSRAEWVQAAVTTWTKQLADLGGRNALLWYRDLPIGSLDLTTAHPGGVAMLMTGRSTKLSSLLREEGVRSEGRRRLRAIVRKSRELGDEHGLETAFVGFGLASWHLPGSPDSARMPCAPVLLRPLTVRASARSEADYVLDLDGPAELNPVLVHYLRSEVGMDVDARALQELAHGSSGFDPYPVYAAVEELCAQLPGFRLARRIVASTFLYTKLPMVADLGAQIDSLDRHDVIAALAGDPDAAAALAVESLATEASREQVESSERGLRRSRAATGRDLRHLPTVPNVLDADDAQLEVIEAARAGNHVVLDTGPGTGATQTIANIIAVLVAQEKRILLVAENRRTIEAVTQRLGQADLAALVLEAGAGPRGAAQVSHQLLEALETPWPSRVKPPDLRERRLQSRQLLEGHRSAMHELRSPFGVSAAQAMEQVSALARTPHPPRSRVRFGGDVLRRLDRDTHRRYTEQLVDCARAGAWTSYGSPDPWFGADLSTDEEVARAGEILDRVAHGGIDRTNEIITDALQGLAITPARTVGQWGATLTTLHGIRGTLEAFRPEIFDEPLDAALAATAPRGTRLTGGETRPGWWERHRITSAVRRLLRPGRPPADLHAALVAAAGQRESWRAFAGAGGRPEIPAELARAQAAHADLVHDLTWLQARLPSGSQRAVLLEMDLARLNELVDALADTPERLAVLPKVRDRLDALQAAGLGELVADLAHRGVEPDDVRAESELTWWTSVIEEVERRDERISGHVGARLRAAAADFVTLERDTVAENARLVREGARDRLAATRRARQSQVQRLQDAAQAGRSNHSLGELLERTGNVAFAARPCWAMSPLAVAALIPPGMHFDTVILADAERMSSAVAISAISRARQVIAVGDPRQPAPAPFFALATDDLRLEGAHAEGSATPGSQGPRLPGPWSQGPAVLDELAQVLPVRSLRWVHRGVDPRVLAFANAHFYDSTLRGLPATSSEPAVWAEAVAGTGMPPEGGGGVESTNAEVDRVIELTLEHARTRPGQSLAVIALGEAHLRLIEDALRRALGGMDAGQLAFFAEEGPEPFLVQTAEHVHGQTRDAVILTVGFGKTPHGRVLYRFGAFGEEGSERLLAAALTRARSRLTVVSTLQPKDLDPARLRSAGPALLRDLLVEVFGDAEMAAPGGRPGGIRADVGGQESVGGEGDAAVARDAAAGGLVREFAERLRAEGLTVREDLGGSDGVELAVGPREFGVPPIAVETDARATSPRSARLRSEQLSGLGWLPMRVFLRDLYRDPAREVHRVASAADGHPDEDEP